MSNMLVLRRQPYELYKWYHLFAYARQLGDAAITEGLGKRLSKVEALLGLSLWEIETVTAHSDDLLNFWLVGGRKVTMLEVQRMLAEIDSWLVGELARVSKSIRWSRSPPATY